MSSEQEGNFQYEAYKLIGAMVSAVLLSIYCFVLVLGGIGGSIGNSIGKLGQKGVPGWDNWFVDFMIWLSNYTIPFSGMTYFVITIFVISFTVVLDGYVMIIGNQISKSTEIKLANEE